ncbi:MAG: DsbC family protein [Oleiphilaceae bacterium]|nr:DsbC family protein [Oleiphilaceae bacterium]
MSYTRSFCRISSLLALVPAVLFALPASAESVEETIRERITEKVPGLTVASVRPAPAQGLYEVVTETGEIVYATESGTYLLTGDLLQLTETGIANVTESGRAERRAETMAGIEKQELISYPAKGEEKARVAVFTDIDCPYCRKLHTEMDRLNELGITVDYFGFPRSGPATASFRKYESVWCADDPQTAMDDAKSGRSVADKSCENPVAEQFELGGRVGVTGTPAIVLEDGRMVRGYVPADELARRLGLM